MDLFVLFSLRVRVIRVIRVRVGRSVKVISGFDWTAHKKKLHLLIVARDFPLTPLSSKHSTISTRWYDWAIHDTVHYKLYCTIQLLVELLKQVRHSP